MKLALYLANDLFNAGSRLHNLYLEKHLTALGYEVILPQREALKFYIKEKTCFDTKGISADCIAHCKNKKVIYVGCLDGADADSGTAVEYSAAVITTGRAILFRTDFRTDLEKELGVNGMFHLEGTTLIYHPCFFTELSEVDQYYKELAQKIHEAVQAIELEQS